MAEDGSATKTYDPDLDDGDAASDTDSEYSWLEYEYDPEDIRRQVSARKRVRDPNDPPEVEMPPEVFIKEFSEALDKQVAKALRTSPKYELPEEKYDFPKDPEQWRERDLGEFWADGPLGIIEPGWDPVWAQKKDWEVVSQAIRLGQDPGIAPFYVPYRRPYPVIPTNHIDIKTPKAVIEELDRTEEFLKWVSFIFRDGSSYEGTVWDDLRHGKGVYVSEDRLVRYEGEWLQNNLEGHGVIEVDIPDIEPIPGSELEAEMRAEGKIIKRDFMDPEDREWLEMDIEDSVRLANGRFEIPFYENEEWVKQFGDKPEKGRYRYAGQWKHSRMHGCGLYEVNERMISGRFYFGELVEDSANCDEETSALHAGIAEVAAAKARMFVNKPDGMIREQHGPFSDPQHPYFYEEEDVWMAPGFINQFYEVPDYWKVYTQEVDQEREMWLNSFYKAPLRIPMPAELEYWWHEEETTPEFIVINKEPEPDPEDPSKLVHTEDPVILHTPTGNIINYVEDEEHGVRLFWQPRAKEGEDVDPAKVEFLPLGFDEFYGTNEERKGLFVRALTAIENGVKTTCDKLGKWTEEKRKEGAMKIKEIEEELEFVEAEICLQEAIEDEEEELKRKEKEEGKKEEEELKRLEKELEMKIRPKKPKVTPSASKKQETSTSVAAEEEEEEEEEEDEEDEEEEEESDFGSVIADRDPKKNDQKGNKPGKSPFSASSLGFASCSLLSIVPPGLQKSFLSWKKQSPPKTTTLPCTDIPSVSSQSFDSVSFPLVHGGPSCNLRAVKHDSQEFHMRKHKISMLHSLSQTTACRSSSMKNPEKNPQKQRLRNHEWLHATPETNFDCIFSLQIPVCNLEPYTDARIA